MKFVQLLYGSIYDYAMKWLQMLFQLNYELNEGTSYHYSDVIMDAIASQITSLTIVYSTLYSGADQSKHQSSASLAFVWGIHRTTAQMGSNAENVSIWWRHHAQEGWEI